MKGTPEQLSTAIAIASNKFIGKLDKGGKPYILHCLRVMNTVLTVSPTDYERASAAVLHDVIEDTPTTYQELSDAGMTTRTLHIIKLMTKVPGQTNEEYGEGILSDKDAMIVKKADLEDNSSLTRLKGLRQKDFQRMEKYIRLYNVINIRLEQHNDIVVVVDDDFPH